MNLFESINNNLKESDFALDFEKNIPHRMRFKHYEFVPVTDSYGRDKGQSLYWITQEPFDDLDIEHFRDAFVDTGFSDAYVTVRDLSNYDFNSDKDEGVLVHISKDGTIDADDYLAKANDRGWFNESEELTEASSFGSIYLAEIGYNGVVGTCRGIGKTEQEAKENAFKLFKQSYPRELEDATYKALKNQGHLRDTDTEHDLWQKLNNIIPGSSGNDGTGTFVDEELMKYVDDWYGINVFDMSSGASNEGGGSLNESEKLNEADNDVELDGESKSSSIYSDNVTSKCKLIKNMLSHYGNVSHVTPQLSFNDEDEEIDFSITVAPDKFARQENSVEIYGTLYLDKDGNFSMVDVKTSSGPNILNRNFITALNALYTFVEHNGDSYDG